MLNEVTVEYFKRFQKESFDISGNIVLAGPNNIGKTTVIQAIAVWNLALQKWIADRGPESGSKAKKYTGVGITRKDFTAIPLREMNLLWNNCSTALSRGELQEKQKLGTPRILKIRLAGNKDAAPWKVCFEFTYRFPELISAKPSADTDKSQINLLKNDLRVVHVPPFSGIGAEETRYDKPYQDHLIGQGKPGDILRNLLVEVFEGKENQWEKLCNDIEEIFNMKLLPPVYVGRPFIVCEYQSLNKTGDRERSSTKLDIASAGSGMLQVLMLLGFFYARPATILLLDEPDAHLHVILQKQVYDRLRNVADRNNCQLIIATHSEVIVESTSPNQIISFFRHPHRLLEDTEKDQVREALKRLTSLDILLAEQSPGVLYVEGETDLNLLREWSRILKHPTWDFLSKNLFWHDNRGGHPRESRAHFFALKSVRPNLKGILLLDGDNRKLPDREISTEGLKIIRWKRYESENYLIHPKVLSRFVQSKTFELFAEERMKQGLDYLKDQLPPAVFNNPLEEHDYLNVTPASKTLLPVFLKAVDIPLTKNEYYQIAAQMKIEEIPDEVGEKLDIIKDTFES